MAFIVPTLQPHLHGRYNFAACKIPVEIGDPAGIPGTGVVYLRGAISPDPMYAPPVPMPPTKLVTVFSLPAGMRPASTRWFNIFGSSYLGMYDAHPMLCVVHNTGDVAVKMEAGSISVDGGLFFDGVTFVAER
jgi:hypothetical protein